MSEFSVDYTVERHAFPWYNSRKVKTFRGLFCVWAGFSTVKSTVRFKFSRTILQKGKPFCRKFADSQNFPGIILQKSMPFSRIIRGKSKLSANYPAESFSLLRKVKISLFKGLSLILKIILYKK
jgi:hypothetical protein